MSGSGGGLGKRASREAGAAPQADLISPATAWTDAGNESSRKPQDTAAINGRLEHLRGSALGFRNLTNYIACAILESGGFRPQQHPMAKSLFTDDQHPRRPSPEIQKLGR